MVAGMGLRIGLLGASRIAPRAIIGPAAERTDVEIVCVAARNQARAQAYAVAHNIPHVADSYMDLVARDDIDLVYVALPPASHRAWTEAALSSGKAVLCEKPFALNWAESMAVIEEATLAGVTLMEAFMWRTHPQTAKLMELIKAKTIGEVGLIQAAFGFKSGFNAESRTWSNAPSTSMWTG